MIADCLQRQAAQLAQRRRAASRRQLLVHRSTVRRAALRGRAGRARRARATGRGGSSRASASRPRSARMQRELPTSVYRVDPSGRVDLVVGEDQVPDPNGLVFSPDYKKLYVVSTGRGPGDTGPGRQGRDVRLRRRRRQQAHQREALQQLHGRRREVRAGRRPLRRRRQPVVLEQRGAQRGLQRRDRVDAPRAS